MAIACIEQNDPINAILDSVIAKLYVGAAGIPKTLVLFYAKLTGDATLIRKVKISIKMGTPIGFKTSKAIARWLKLNGTTTNKIGSTHVYITAIYGMVLAAVELEYAYHCICKSEYKGDNYLNTKESIEYYWNLFFKSKPVKKIEEKKTIK